MTPDKENDKAEMVIDLLVQLRESKEERAKAWLKAANEACDKRRLREALKLIVALDSDAHPGLATWNEARSKANDSAKMLLEEIGEGK